MYMALTEEQAKEIRKLGISVIEWKNCIRKSVNVVAYIFNKVAEKAAQAWKAITDAIDTFIDAASLVVEEIKEKFYKEPMALKDVKCYNPAFDVTDHSLITAIVTEKGICYPPYTESLAALF